jgi:hypothetical protein
MWLTMQLLTGMSQDLPHTQRRFELMAFSSVGVGLSGCQSDVWNAGLTGLSRTARHELDLLVERISYKSVSVLLGPLRNLHSTFTDALCGS